MKNDIDDDHAFISSEDFVVISIEDEEFDANQRMMKLTNSFALIDM